MEMEMETEMKMFTLHSHSQWCYVVLEVAFPFEFCYRPVFKKKETARELRTAVTEKGALQSSDMYKKAALIKAHYYSSEY